MQLQSKLTKMPNEIVENEESTYFKISEVDDEK